MAKTKKKKAAPKKKAAAKKKKVNKAGKAKKAKAKRLAAPLPKRGQLRMEMIATAEVVTEVACKTGTWTPSRSTGTVKKDEELGTVGYGALTCTVKASTAGNITWIEDTCEVNRRQEVCTIELTGEINT